MRKKFLTILMSMLMVFVMMPMGTWTTYAAGGNLSQEDGYYLIEDYADLKAFADLVNRGETSANAKLTANITCTGDDWVPIGSRAAIYIGTFDGDDHIIKGISNEESGGGDYQGLFGLVGDAGEIKNVGLKGGSITGRNCVGGLVGNCAGTITNCYNSGEVSGTKYVGGVVGYAYSGEVTNSYNTGKVSGADNVGGVAGYNVQEIDNCYNTGEVSGDVAVGGVAGYNEAGAAITNSYNTGTVSGTANAAGGVVGENDGAITNSYNTGTVSGTANYAGGVVGNNYGSNNYKGEITSCYNTGEVSGKECVGGVAGFNGGGAEITNCYNTGEVSGKECVGGVAGYNEAGAAITNSYNIGEVSGTNYVGGVAAYSDGTITNCYYDKAFCSAVKAIGTQNDSATVKGLTTTQMTGTNALRYMPFTNQDPWLTKAEEVDTDTSYRYYPHLKGFNFDSNNQQMDSEEIAAADWPPKVTVKVTWDEPESYIYNGSDLKPTVNKIIISNGSTDVTVDPKDYTVKYYKKIGIDAETREPIWSSDDITPVNAGSYKAVITFKTGGHPSIEKGFEISKAPLTITAKDQTYEYNGQEQGEGDPAYDDAAVIAEKVTVEGLKGNDQITSLELTGQQKEIGEAAIEITGFSINNNNAAKDNYIVTLVPGKLTITGHTLTKTDEVPATCEKDGTKAYWTCSTCKKMFSDEKGENEIKAPEVIKAGHELTKTDEVPATCEKDGTKAYWTCSKCKKMFSDENGEKVITAPEVIKASGHSLTKTDEVPATCEKDGTKAYWTCSKCKKMFSDEKGENEIKAPEVIKASGHDWGEWTVTKEATETEDGEEQRVCKNDPDHKETRVIPAIEHVHKLTETPAKAATCTEDGNSAYWKCDKGDNPCGKYFSDAEGTKEIEKDSWVIKASGHDWGEWTVTKEATETEEGEEQRVCKNDPEHKETRVIPVIGHEHKLTETPAKAATCTEDGNSAYWTCDKGDNPCGRYFSDAEGTAEIEKDSWVITATGHDWGEWTVTKEATETEEGEEQRVCKNDPEHKETRAIPVIPASVTYSNVSGEGNSWYKGSDATSDFSFKRSVDDASTFSHFTGIRVDNNPVDEANYSKEPGSVIIKLKPEYLETLARGKHTLEARFDDGNGSATAEFTIAEAEEEDIDDEGDDVNGNGGGSKGSKKNVKTGDESLVAFWASLLGVSMIGLIMLFAARLRLRRKDR